MAALAGVILIFITAAVCYTIGMRYLFTKTTIWLMQTTEYALLWIVFLATTWLLRARRPYHDRSHLYLTFKKKQNTRSM